MKKILIALSFLGFTGGAPLNTIACKSDPNSSINYKEYQDLSNDHQWNVVIGDLDAVLSAIHHWGVRVQEDSQAFLKIASDHGFAVKDVQNWIIEPPAHHKKDGVNQENDLAAFQNFIKNRKTETEILQETFYSLFMTQTYSWIYYKLNNQNNKSNKEEVLIKNLTFLNLEWHYSEIIDETYEAVSEFWFMYIWEDYQKQISDEYRIVKAEEWNKLKDK